MTRRPVRGLAPQPAREPAPRPPGPPSIQHPDGRTFTRAEDGLYYCPAGAEVFSQSALRDLLDRARERLDRACATGDPLMTAIRAASTTERLRELWTRAGSSSSARSAILGRLAVLAWERRS